MNERRKSYLALFIVFLALLIIGLLETLLHGSEPNFREQIRSEVAKVLKHRDGIVLWWDRTTGEEQVFGNAKLKDQLFRPGSLMKLLTAEAALEQGLNPKYRCQGHDHLQGKRVHCWTPKGHGKLRLPQALAQSCNLYFARLGLRLGPQPLKKILVSYGLEKNLSEPTPSLAEFAIGDTPAFQITPSQVAKFWDQYLDKQTQSNFQAIRQGLHRAAGQGTAMGAASTHQALLAKTGTADAESKAYSTHGWLVGAYPADQPRYGLVIFLKNAHGYREAAALGGKIFQICTK